MRLLEEKCIPICGGYKPPQKKIKNLLKNVFQFAEVINLLKKKKKPSMLSTFKKSIITSSYDLYLWRSF